MRRQLLAPINTESYETLMFVDDLDSEYEEDLETTDDDERRDEDYRPSPKKMSGTWEIYTEEEMQAIHNYRFSGKTRPLKFSTVQNRYRTLKSEEHMKWVCRKVRNRDNRMKMRKIKEAMITKFQEMMVNRCRVHQRHLKRWAMREAREVGHSRFVCSTAFLDRFKKKYRIGMRLVTATVSRVQLAGVSDKEAELNEFIVKARASIQLLKPDQVFNTDQSGCQKELHTRATLAFKGTRRIEARVQSKSALTHSYTIQPLISLDGKLHSPMLVVLQEEGGKFGPRVMATMKRPRNLMIRAGRSHIVTKEIVNNWFLENYFKVASGKSLLFCDALPAFKDRTVIDLLKSESVNYEVQTISAHCTGRAQPLDVFFFLQWKSFMKIIDDHVINEDIDINMYSRDEILTLQSLIHNQFANPRFKNFIIESFRLSGLIDDNLPFINPVKYCFDNLPDDCMNTDQEQKCGGLPLIKCSYCDKCLCFEHFFMQYHSHFDETLPVINVSLPDGDMSE